MTLRVGEIYDFLDSIAPFKTALSFDNCGLLVGDRNTHVDKVLLALDITSDVVEEAVKLGAELIISHHPVIFRPIKSLNPSDVVYKLARYGISAICAHTNLDMARHFGVNSSLAVALKVINTEILHPDAETPEDELSCGLIGELNPSMDSLDFVAHVKRNLACNGVRYTDVGNKKISRVALSSGAGGDYLEYAIEKGADAFVTGEIKHHMILRAREAGVLLVDVGHFKSEDVVIEPLLGLLRNKFPSAMFSKSTVFSDSINYM